MEYFLKYHGRTKDNPRVQMIEYVQGEQKVENVIKRIQAEQKHPVFIQVFKVACLEKEVYNYL